MSLPGTSPQVRILVADDDPTLTQHLVWALKDRGFDAHAANSREGALQLLAGLHFDQAVIDLRLGGDNGLELLSDVLRINPAMRVVILTGYGSIATAVRAVRLGAVDYLTKPANADDVVAALGASAERSSMLALAEPGSDSRATEMDVGSAPTLAQTEWEHIQRVLSDCDGNVTHAASKLGLHRRSLQRKLARRR